MVWSFGILFHLAVTSILKTKRHKTSVVQYFRLTLFNKESQYFSDYSVVHFYIWLHSSFKHFNQCTKLLLLLLL
jgi:hypothetical protein